MLKTEEEKFMQPVKKSSEAVQKSIKIVGGAKELAAIIGVSYKSVLDWKNGRTGVNLQNCLKIEQATKGKVKKEELLPNYPWEALTKEH